MHWKGGSYGPIGSIYEIMNDWRRKAISFFAVEASVRVGLFSGPVVFTFPTNNMTCFRENRGIVLRLNSPNPYSCLKQGYAYCMTLTISWLCCVEHSRGGSMEVLCFTDVWRHIKHDHKLTLARTMQGEDVANIKGCRIFSKRGGVVPNRSGLTDRFELAEVWAALPLIEQKCKARCSTHLLFVLQVHFAVQ